MSSKSIYIALIIFYFATISTFAKEYKIGNTGDFKTLSHAFNSGKIADGDVLNLIDAEYIDSSIEINKNVTIKSKDKTTIYQDPQNYITNKPLISIAKDKTVSISNSNINIEMGKVNDPGYVKFGIKIFGSLNIDKTSNISFDGDSSLDNEGVIVNLGTIGMQQNSN